jgi:outer membrane immunogenic protein
MRWWACGLLIAMTCPALAADYDDSWLRGSQTIGPAVGAPPRLYRTWAGVYGGVQVGEDFRGIDFRSVPVGPLQSAISQDAVLTALAGSLPGMSSLPQVNTNGPSYGGFLGYNWQIDDMVGGLELNVNRASLHQTAYSSVTRSYIVTTAGGSTYAPTSVTVNTGATVDVSTYSTLRGRVGWAIGNFLPYMVAGVSFAQVNSSKFFDVSYFGVDVTTPACTPPVTSACINAAGNYPFSDVSHGKYLLGFDGALGVDYLLTNNAFVRGEAEYLQLGTTNLIKLNTVSTRIGLGLKY